MTVKKVTVSQVQGLGDAVSIVTRLTGIDQVVGAIEKATGADCGCDQRRELLNRLVPFRFQPEERKTK